MEMKIGVWSDPVEGREDVSQERKAGKKCGLVKARSMALGLWVPVKGNRVYMPGVLRRVKPKSAARSKYGPDSLSSFEERSLKGLFAELWMLKSPATRYGYSRSKRDDSGETEWEGWGSGLA